MGNHGVQSVGSAGDLPTHTPDNVRRPGARKESNPRET